MVVNTLALMPSLLSDRLPAARRQTFAENLAVNFERESLQSLSKLFGNYAAYASNNRYAEYTCVHAYLSA